MTTESSKEIDVNKLLDRPYSELSNEEIEAVIDFRASVKARDKAHAERLQAIRDAGDRIAAQQQEQVQAAHDAQDALLQASLKRLNRLNGGA
jgi:hypothetical protein|nr:MAG TPA: hypothetical protein [Bacteriophage sp.]